MTIQEAISKIDGMYPNTYKSDIKIKYLSKLDGIIKKEVIDKFYEESDKEFKGYDNAPMTTELLVKEPYTEIYIFWLQAWIDYWNGDYDKYNAAIGMYEAEYNAFAENYNLTHTRKKVQMKFF